MKISIEVEGERAVEIAESLSELNFLLNEVKDLLESKNDREIKNGGKNKSG